MKIQINGNEITVNGNSVMLSLSHVIILKELNRKSPRVVRIENLMVVAGIDRKHTLRQQISTLRKALSVFSGLDIVTHPKTGYALKIK